MRESKKMTKKTTKRAMVESNLLLNKNLILYVLTQTSLGENFGLEVDQIFNTVAPLVNLFCMKKQSKANTFYVVYFPCDINDQ